MPAILVGIGCTFPSPAYRKNPTRYDPVMDTLTSEDRRGRTLSLLDDCEVLDLRPQTGGSGFTPKCYIKCYTKCYTGSESYIEFYVALLPVVVHWTS